MIVPPSKDLFTSDGKDQSTRLNRPSGDTFSWLPPRSHPITASLAKVGAIAVPCQLRLGTGLALIDGATLRASTREEAYTHTIEFLADFAADLEISPQHRLE